jgi:hypothetical protein
MDHDFSNLTRLLSDDEWIALIEGQPLPAARAAEVRAILQQHPQLTELAAELQADRQALSVIDAQRSTGAGELTPPSELLERIEQAMEREALVGLASVEAKAPLPQELPRYVPGPEVRTVARGLERVPARWIGPLGLAASLLIVAGGGVLMYSSLKPKGVQPILVAGAGDGSAKPEQGAMRLAKTERTKVDESPVADPTVTPLAAGKTSEPAATPTSVTTANSDQQIIAVAPAPAAVSGPAPVPTPAAPAAPSTEIITTAASSPTPPTPATTAVASARAETLSDEQLLAAAVEGRLLAVIVPASMQRRMDIDTRLTKLSEQPTPVAPVQRIGFAMAQGGGRGEQSVPFTNNLSQQVALHDGFDVLPADIQQRLNLAVAQSRAGDRQPLQQIEPAELESRAGRDAAGASSAGGMMPGAAPAPSSLQMGTPATLSAVLLTQPRVGRATTPATVAGMALLRRSLTGTTDEVRLVVLPAQAKQEEAGQGDAARDSAARVWLRSAGIGEPMVPAVSEGEILWWTAATPQLTPRVQVPVLIVPGK